MKVIYGINKIHKFKRPVVALGVFDGVHLAHIRILKAAVRKARRLKGTAVLVTFWPHPQKEPSIYSLEHRLRLISQLGIDAGIVLRFNKAFARLSAEKFVKKILLEKIGTGYILVGKNFRFGRDAQGDYNLLNKLAQRYNFKLKVFAVLRINGRAVSSTYIRRLITQGNLAAARKLLKRPVSVLGTVIRGDSLGRRLGFPTANIDPHHEVLPPSGVYAARIMLNRRSLKGVCYIGSKPTFKSGSAKRVEVYIFNFKKNIYAQNLEINFFIQIRKEKKLKSSSALIRQIRKDILHAQAYFSLHK
jgi:riboflavin kinase/FMN adenylyltransferase